MASRDVSIRFNVEGGDAINRELQNVESRNRSITDNLNRSSKEQVDYSRNTLSNIEAQNRALQEQSNITPMQRGGEGLRTTVSPPQEDTSSFDELRNTTNNFVQNLIDLIKDLIDTTQEGAGKELRADKENTRKSIEAEGRLSRREIQENEDGFEALRKSLQTDRLEADEEKDKETRGQDGLRTGVGAANTIIGSKNEAYAIASLLTAIPFIGSALSKFGERALQATEAYQAGMGRNVGLTGGSLGAYAGVGANMAAYGTTMAEFLQERVGVSRARGGAAGSFGADLVALRGDVSFLIEIKTSIKDTIHFSSIEGKLQEQAEKMLDECEKTKTLPIYAYRLKGIRGDSWRLFTLNVQGLEGRASIVHKRLPMLECSKNGNFIMRWDQGLPLSQFISYLCR